jgi:N utilization substance protein B
MLNRRHLRIKVLQALYAFYQTENKDVYAGEKELLKAIERIYDLYLYLFLTFPELKAKGEFRLAENKKKLLPSEDDLNPTRKFVDNAIIALIENHVDLRTEAENRRINWLGAKERSNSRWTFKAERCYSTHIRRIGGHGRSCISIFIVEFNWRSF